MMLDAMHRPSVNARDMAEQSLDGPTRAARYVGGAVTVERSAEASAVGTQMVDIPGGRLRDHDLDGSVEV